VHQRDDDAPMVKPVAHLTPAVDHPIKLVHKYAQSDQQ
jgi:hypothetical protein